MRYTKQGLFIDSIPMDGAGEALAFGPDRILYYTDYAKGAIGRINVTTFPPRSMGFFIPPNTFLRNPVGIAIASDGLYPL